LPKKETIFAARPAVRLSLARADRAPVLPEVIALRRAPVRIDVDAVRDLARELVFRLAVAVAAAMPVPFVILA
jgi:hypothetical protein